MRRRPRCACRRFRTTLFRASPARRVAAADPVARVDAPTRRMRAIRIGIRMSDNRVRGCTRMHALESKNRHEERAMTDSPLEPELTKKVIASLNNILELELAGVVRYMHYSFMIFGHNRIPIVAWLRDQGERIECACRDGRRAHHRVRRASVAQDRFAARDAQARRERDPHRSARAREGRPRRVLRSCSRSWKARASCSRNTRATRSRRRKCTSRTSAR